MLQKCSLWVVASVFFLEPTTNHYLMEISRKTKLAHTSVKKHLEALKKKDIIKEFIEVKGARKYPFFKANIDSVEYKSKKELHNLFMVQESGLIEFLKTNYMPKSIVLFGSYARAEDIEDSDIDIFIESKREELNLKKFESLLGRKIQLHFRENFKDYSKELKNNILNGIILQGYLEVF
ncbi:MAG: nucleotidyltransferase domain-containing protein [Nanoarchaeota archaeon]|nr:nucleotidyltransferase domain-containing protein [Nanoarchaeota archaeon]MBU1030855.1 nucleotidyltransferase domain-containing protein [Nanoarchaeota archaeon]